MTTESRCAELQAVALTPHQVIHWFDTYLRSTSDAALLLLPGDIPYVMNGYGPRRGLPMTRADWTRYVLQNKLQTCREYYLGDKCITEEWVKGHKDAQGRFVKGYMKQVMHETHDESPWGRYNAFAAPNVEMPWLRGYYESATTTYSEQEKSHYVPQN